MARCRVDQSIERVVVNGFDFPLGVYPVEALEPREGYTVAFEAADEPGSDSYSTQSEDENERDQWPDRYVWDVVVRASRLEPLCRSLFAMLPGRVYPILDVLGNDAYREVDPYVGYELVGQERFLESVRRFRGFVFEDGLVGFGAMSEEPFLYVFVDEHKIVTIRAETALKERVESVLAAFELKQVEQLAGADAAVHEHRSVLDAPSDRPDLLTADEIVEELRDSWGLQLNVDPRGNTDESGKELGITGWRCVTRLIDPLGDVRYREVFLTANCLLDAEELAASDTVGSADDEAPGPKSSSKSLNPTGRTGKSRPPAETGYSPDAPPSDFEPDQPDELTDDLEDENTLTCDMIVTDRLRPEDFSKAVAGLGGKRPNFKDQRVWAAKWLDQSGSKPA